MAYTTDTFNRANSTNNLGTTDGSGTLDPLTWVQHVGTLGINSNQAYASAIVSFLAIATVETSQADVDVSLKINAQGAALVFRLSNAANFFQYYVTGGGIYLNAVVAGGYVGLYTGSGFTNGDTLRVVANGTSIKLFHNSTLLTTITEPFNATATKHGYHCDNTSARVDDFSVGPLFATVTGTVTIGIPFSVDGTGTGESPPVPSIPAQPFYDILVDASPSNLDLQMRNSVYAARAGGTTQTATSTSSIDIYGPYEYKRTDLGLADDTQVAEWATIVVELYAYPQIVLADVTFQPALHGESWETWADVLDADLVTDLVRVVWAPPNHPENVVDALSRVVGYHHTISRQQWEMEWQLVDAQALRFADQIFTLGESDRDQLDAGWVLGFTTTGGT